MYTWTLPSTYSLYTDWGVTKIELRNNNGTAGDPGWKLYFGSAALAVEFMSRLDRVRLKDHGGNIPDDYMWYELDDIVRIDNTPRLVSPNARDHQWVHWIYTTGNNMYINYQLRL